jgi:hypothetical protein
LEVIEAVFASWSIEEAGSQMRFTFGFALRALVTLSEN